MRGDQIVLYKYITELNKRYREQLFKLKDNVGTGAAVINWLQTIQVVNLKERFLIIRE